MDREYPYAGSYIDRHGKRRWRFRRAGKTIALPGSPGEPEFEAAYAGALAGEPIRREKAKILRLPTAPPKSLRAAWRILTTQTVEWQQLEPETRHTQTLIAERFLRSPVVEGEPLTFGDVPVADLQRKHIKAILAKRAATPHAAAHLLRIIRKLTGVALDEGWIEYDPTYRISLRPPYQGWKAWSDDARAAFERHWPLGTTPRLAYALALYFGHRRSDIAKVKWSDLEEGGGNVVQRKTRAALWIPMHPELARTLEAAERKSEYVLLTRHGQPFSRKGLSVRMRAWTKAAGLPPGHTLHGLRKTLGKKLAESGATTRQIMAILGHRDIAHAELYTREAEQRRLATDGMQRLLDGAVLTGKRDAG
ncbi:MAG: tyrosine-type recombinase/integrase [Variibacter sp.]|nr:tyrosine-type recombinase/integrase [Variibacter sp.]